MSAESAADTSELAVCERSCESESDWAPPAAESLANAADIDESCDPTTDDETDADALDELDEDAKTIDELDEACE